MTITRDSFDSRDFPFKKKGNIVVHEEINLSKVIRKREWQEWVNACGGFAGSSVVEIIQYQFHPEIACELSQLFPWQCAKEFAGRLTENVGVSSRGILKALEKFGIPPEADWPFDPSKQGVKAPQSVFKKAKQRRVKSYLRCQTIDECKNALAQGFPVFVGLQLREGFKEFDSSYMSRPKIGGHFVVVVGFTRNGNALIFNSWNDDVFEMPWQYLMADVWDMWAVTGLKLGAALTKGKKNA